MVRKISLMCALAAVLALPYSVSAQETRTFESEQQQPARRGQQGQQAQRFTQHFASCLALGNHAEIELAKLAQKQGTDPAVKDFARQMIEDHQKQLQQLQQFVPTAEPRAQERTAAKVTPEGRVPEQAGTQPGARGRAGGAHSPMLQVATETATRKLELTKELLSQKQGHNFDMGYIGQQIVAHVGMVAELEALQGHGTPEFQQVTSAALKSTKQHLEHAKQIAMKLNREEEGAGETSRRRSTTDSAPRDR